jgi:N-acetyl-gamma-glutamyl-phosphate reductase
MPLLEEADMTALRISSNDLRDTNMMEIFVCGSEEQVLLCSRLDNLGKGASGAAVQCLNIMMGADETTGLL